MTAALRRPFPERIDPAYEEHFAALGVGELVVRRCAGCARVQWPPRPTCGSCQGDRFLRHAVVPRGEVYTFTVVRRAFHPWFLERLPYAVAVVELDDGLRLTGLFDGDVDALRCGLLVVGRGERLGGAPALIWSEAARR